MRTSAPKVVRQEVHFVPEGRTVPMAVTPYRVWTLFSTDPDVKPEVPFVPVHNVNAFLEDRVHDWIVRGGVLRYFSRVARDRVWILCEFTE